MGMRPIVIDSGEAKKKLATTLGAEVFLDFKEETDIASRIKEIADGLGANGVIVTAWQTYKGSYAPHPYNPPPPPLPPSFLHLRLTNPLPQTQSPTSAIEPAPKSYASVSHQPIKTSLQERRLCCSR